MKRHDLRPLRRLFSRRERGAMVRVPDQIRIPPPAPTPATTPAVARDDSSPRCPACELREYLDG
jgi:hypothetical protein